MNLIFVSFCLIIWREILFIFQTKNWSNVFFVSFDSSIKLDRWAVIADWNDKNDKKEEEEEEEEEEKEKVDWNDKDCCHWINCKDCYHKENCYHEKDCKDCYHKKDCKNCCHDW